MIICGVEPAGLLKVATPETAGFSIYPNPNNGTFNVEFNAEERGDVTIAVYDMRGRQIFKKQTLAPGGVFSDTISLNAESGVYLVNIGHGGKTTSKKIIIK